MAEKIELKPSAPWYRLNVTEDDWRAANAGDLLKWYSQMKLIRRFEE